MPSATITRTVEVKISPALKRKLLLKLKTFATLKSQVDAAKSAQEAIKREIEEMFVKAGEFDALQSGVKMEGFSTKHVSGVSTRLDKLKLIEATGITAQQLNDAYVTKPKKAYVEVRCPGDKEHREED